MTTQTSFATRATRRIGATLWTALIATLAACTSGGLGTSVGMTCDKPTNIHTFNSPTSIAVPLVAPGTGAPSATFTFSVLRASATVPLGDDPWVWFDVMLATGYDDPPEGFFFRFEPNPAQVREVGTATVSLDVFAYAGMLAPGVYELRMRGMANTDCYRPLTITVQ